MSKQKQLDATITDIELIGMFNIPATVAGIKIERVILCIKLQVYATDVKKKRL